MSRVECGNLTEQEWSVVRSSSQGDLITLDGKRWQIKKKTTSALMLRRYYWFSKYWDRIMGEELQGE